MSLVLQDKCNIEIFLSSVAGIFIWNYWQYKHKHQIMRLEFSYTLNNKWIHILSTLVSVWINQLLNSRVCIFVFVLVLILYVPVNNFSVMSVWDSLG